MTEIIENPANLSHLLVCPQCQGELALILDKGLCCEHCHVTYLIQNGIPLMLVDAAIADALH